MELLVGRISFRRYTHIFGWIQCCWFFNNLFKKFSLIEWNRLNIYQCVILSTADLYNKADHGWPPLSPTLAAPHPGGWLLLLATYNLARGEPLEFFDGFFRKNFFFRLRLCTTMFTWTRVVIGELCHPFGQFEHRSFVNFFGDKTFFQVFLLGSSPSTSLLPSFASCCTSAW